MIYNTEFTNRWYLEIKDHPDAARLDTPESVAVIYKGFKLEIFSDVCCVFDVRYRDLYGPISKKNLNLMIRMGFEKACDYIQYYQDIKRIEKTKRVLSNLETKQRRLIKEGRVKAKRTINGLQVRKEEHLQNYYLYVSRSQNLKQKLRTFNLI